MLGRMKGLFLIFALISLILTAFSPVHGESAGLSKVVFYVN
jgi:uncharacterized membrane protein YtjA (UPF0391 family)